MAVPSGRLENGRLAGQATHFGGLVMASTVTVSLGGLIDETLSHLYRTAERPRRTAVGTQSLDSSSDTTLCLTDPELAFKTKLLEVGQELMLITDKSSDDDPVFTVVREYLGTPNVGLAPGGTEVLIDPPWPRYDVARWLQRCVSTVFNTYLPKLESAEYVRESGFQFIQLPSTCVDVKNVRHISALTGRVVDVAGWQFEQDLPTALTDFNLSSSKLLRLPASIRDEDPLIVTYTTPYSWSGTGEAATVALPLGSEDLPPLWAAAYGQMRREVSRAELDKLEEWNQEQAIRAGVNLRMVRELWGEFYRRLDEARKLQYVPKHRPYRKMPRVS